MKGVIIYRSLIFDKVGIWNPDLVVSRDLGIDFTDSNLVK